MKITKKHTNSTINFGMADRGDVFVYNSQWYIKTDMVNDDDAINAVCLETGAYSYFDYDDRVKIANAELIVEV